MFDLLLLLILVLWGLCVFEAQEAYREWRLVAPYVRDDRYKVAAGHKSREARRAFWGYAAVVLVLPGVFLLVLVLKERVANM